MTRGFLTEDGPRPEFAAEFNAVELATSDYPSRTRANARDSDGTIWFGDPDSPGGRTTLDACERLGRPVLEVLDGFTLPSDVANWIEAEEIGVLNVAGSRESRAPGIGERAERFLISVFRRLTR